MIRNLIRNMMAIYLETKERIGIDLYRGPDGQKLIIEIG